MIDRITRLKEKRNAIILAHNYQRPEVQDIADFVGDSLGLSIAAAETDADVIVFCGVHFMAETAKILSPEKTVLLPDPNAGCPMADMITASDLKELKQRHPLAKVICYVNTSAEVKAECDMCCTSANAVRLAGKLAETGNEIIFVPDKHLASYVSDQTGSDFIVWNGYCPTHARLLPEHITTLKQAHPEAEIIVHPECRADVRRMADFVGSTEGMCRYASQSHSVEFIVGTEVGMIHRMKKENPGKTFYPLSSSAVCPNMKRTTLESVLWALEDMSYPVEVPEITAQRARHCIENMLEFNAQALV